MGYLDLVSDLVDEYDHATRRQPKEASPSAAGRRSAQNGHKTRADEPVVSDARDKSASAHQNCLPASAGTKADAFPSPPQPIQP